MSRMEPEILIHTPAHLLPKTETALASIQAERLETVRRGHIVMAGLMGYGDAVSQPGAWAVTATGAKMFCIAFAMITPNLLFIKYVLGA